MTDHIQDFTGQSTSKGVSDFDEKLEGNQLTDEKFDLMKASAKKLLENGKAITKEMNNVFKLEDLENDENDFKKSDTRVEKLQKMRADADEMNNIMESINENLEERSLKISGLASKSESIKISSSKFKKLASQLRLKKSKSDSTGNLKKRKKDWSLEISTVAVGVAALILFLI